MINKIYTKTDDELYHKYRTQNKEQPAKLCFDVPSGFLSAYVEYNIGNIITHRVFNNLDIEWTIPPLKMKPLKNLMDEIEPLCEKILCNFSIVYNGNNYIGNLEEDALDAVYEIRELIDTKHWEPDDIYYVWPASDYYSPLGKDEIILDTCGLNINSNDLDIRRTAEEEVQRAEVILDEDDVYNYLLSIVEDLKEDNLG